MPPDLAVRIELLRIYYNNALAGYFSKKKTLDFFSRKYYWLNINIDVLDHVSTCNICQYIYML